MAALTRQNLHRKGIQGILMHKTMDVNNKALVCSLAKIIDYFLALYHENVACIFAKGFDVKNLDNQLSNNAPLCTIGQKKSFPKKKKKK